MVLFCMCGQLPAQLLFLDCFLPVHFLPLVSSSYVLKYKSPVSKDRHLKMYFSICVRICSEVNMVGARFWDDSHFSWLFSPRGLWHLVCNSMLTSFPLVWFHIRAQASECEKKKESPSHSVLSWCLWVWILLLKMTEYCLVIAINPTAINSNDPQCERLISLAEKQFFFSPPLYKFWHYRHLIPSCYNFKILIEKTKGFKDTWEN